jgi:hypothetical protein
MCGPVPDSRDRVSFDGVDYRDPLGQAHERIARLEEELARERAKNAPPSGPPVTLASGVSPHTADATTAPPAKVSLLRFWSVPVAAASAIPLAIHRLPFESWFDAGDAQAIWYALYALLPACLLFALEALVRTHAGHATMVSRLLLVCAGACSLPFAFVLLPVVGTICGIGVAAACAIIGTLKLAHWIKGTGGSDHR